MSAQTPAPRFVYSQDAKAITVYTGEIIDSQRSSQLVESPEVITDMRLVSGTCTFVFAGGHERTVSAHANLKLFTEV